MKTILSITILLLLSGCGFLAGNRKNFVYVIQEGATVDEIQHCIEIMRFSNFRELSQRLVVVGDNDVSIEALCNVQRAIGRLRGYQYTLHEKKENRSIKLSMRVPDGDFGTVVDVHIANGIIYYGEERLSSAMFQEVVQSAVKHTGVPLRIYFGCQGNTLRDVFDAVELLADGLKVVCDEDIRLVLEQGDGNQ